MKLLYYIDKLNRQQRFSDSAIAGQDYYAKFSKLIYIKLSPGVESLVHSSEITWRRSKLSVSQLKHFNYGLKV